jgi:hypothetical protein
MIAKMNNQHQLNSLDTALSGIKIDDFKLGGSAKKPTEIKRKEKDQKEQREIIRRLKIQNKKLLQQVAALKVKAKENSAESAIMLTKVNYMKKLNHSLSDALGSCSNCWGEDPNCSACLGEGIPGWRNINKRLFNMYVLPCLDKLYLHEKK